jgi:hypothetical protein
MAHGGIRGGVREAFGLSLVEILQGFDRYVMFRATWLPAISSTASIWGFITLLFFFTTYRKRVASARKLKQWDDEERLLMWDETSGPERDDEPERTLH